MKSMYIGSGDVSALLSGLNTKTHAKLLQRFVSDEVPYYNAELSPIDALRTGAILEKRYILTLPDDYYPQFKVVCDEMDVLKSSIDFAQLNMGKIVNFEELKTCYFDDFLKFMPLESNQERVNYIKKKYKANYNQVQHQLLCTGLDSATITFLSVNNYIDEENRSRVIKDGEYIKTIINRDKKVISLIKDRAKIFQQIKNVYNKK